MNVYMYICRGFPVALDRPLSAEEEKEAAMTARAARQRDGGKVRLYIACIYGEEKKRITACRHKG